MVHLSRSSRFMYRVLTTAVIISLMVSSMPVATISAAPADTVPSSRETQTLDDVVHDGSAVQNRHVSTTNEVESIRESSTDVAATVVDVQAVAYDTQTAPTAAVSAATFPLGTGWQLISNPEQPTDTSPAAVLASIAGSYDLVSAYDACDSTDPWKDYDPDSPTTSDLTDIDHTMGIWVRMTTPVVFSSAGTLRTSTDIPLCIGWNLIGYPLDVAQPITSALTSIAGKYTRVFGYDAYELSDPWAVFSLGVPAWANDISHMEPGKGYWVYATENTTLTISRPAAPPAISFDAPEGMTVTKPISITGAIAAESIANWTLEYRMQDDDTWIVITTGSTALGSTFAGSFDPTLLLNGMFEIRLTATDSANQTTAESLNVIVEGEMKIGNFTISFVDLAIPVSGIPIQVIRTYDSRNKLRGDFGISWSLGIRDVRMQGNREIGSSWIGTRSTALIPTYCIEPAKPHILTVTLIDGTIYKFKPVLTPKCQTLLPINTVTVGYEPLPGTRATLRPLVDANARVFGSYPGELELFDLSGQAVLNPSQYELTLNNGTKLEVLRAGGLRSITDRNGNKVSVSIAGISHSSGKGINFVRDQLGRITTITDTQGATLEYVYNSDGDLVSFVNQKLATTMFTYDERHNLIDIIDPSGVRVSRAQYGEEGRLVSVSDISNNSTTLTHDISSRVETVQDRLGNQITYEYDERGNILAIQNALGFVATYAYDADGNLTSETDEMGNVTIYDYDSQGNRIKQTDSLGNATMWAYDNQNNLTAITDAAGATTTYSYDSRGNLTTITDPENNVTTMTYTPEGRLRTYQDSTGTLHTGIHDVSGNLISDRYSIETIDGPINAQWDYEYNALGNLLSIEGPDGSGSAAMYDALGSMIQTTNPLGYETNINWTVNGEMVGMQLPGGITATVEKDSLGRDIAVDLSCCGRTGYDYDAEGRVVAINSADGNSTQVDWNAVGQRATITDALGFVTRFSYDPIGRLVTAQSNDGATVRYEYDKAGRVTKITDPEGNPTSFLRDEVGRIVRTNYADGRYTETGYNKNGQVITQTSFVGGMWAYNYGPAGRLLSVKDPLGHVVTYQHDSNGMISSYTDADGNATRILLDPLGRMLRRTLPEGQSERFVYDSGGRPTMYTDFAGRETAFAFTPSGDLSLRTFPDGTTENRTYDASGRLNRVADAQGQSSIIYDDFGRIIRFTGRNTISTDYIYDTGGQLDSVSTDVGTTSYDYSLAGLPSRITDSNGGVTNIRRDLVGRVKEIVLPDNKLIEQSFDSIGRITGVTLTTDAGNTLLVIHYAYDSAGRLASTSDSTGRNVLYGYDNLDQLIEEQTTEPEGNTELITYRYDRVGNLIERTQGTERRSFSYDNNNRLLNDGISSYTWNDNGELIERTTANASIQYQYDPQGRLVRFQRAGASPVTVEYEYDFHGLLSARTSNGQRTIFVWDLRSGIYPQLLELRTETGELLSRYTYGDLFPISVSNAEGDTNYYIVDQVGTIRAIAEQFGNTVSVSSFSAFGRPGSGAINGNLGFAGNFTDPDTSLVFMRSRWYDPETARFLQPDSYPGTPEDPRTLNRYSYSLNDPLNRLDPTGQYSISSINVGITIAGILGSIALPHFPKAQTAIAKGLLGDLAFTPFSASLIGGSLNIPLGPPIKSLTRNTPIRQVPGMPTLTFGIDALQFGNNSETSFYGYTGPSVTIGASTLNLSEKTSRSYQINAGMVFDTPTPKDYEGFFLTMTFSALIAKQLAGFSFVRHSFVGAESMVAFFTSPTPTEDGLHRSHGFSKPTPWVSGSPNHVDRGFTKHIAIGFSVSYYWELLRLTRDGWLIATELYE